MGKTNVTSKTIQTLRSRLNEDDKVAMLREAAESTDWVYNAIRQIIRGTIEMKNIAGFSDNDKRGLFRNTADKMGINDAIVEKDFWVCFTLDWRVLGYGREEPWEKRSNTKQDAFNKEANARAEVFLAETFCPVIKEGLSQELGREADIHMDEDGKLIGKADMFTKRTIRPDRSVTSVDMSPRSGKYPIS